MELKEKIRRKELTIGFCQFMPSPQITEAAGYVGFDWLWLCIEHGTLGFGSDLENCIRAAEATGMVPMVRVTDPAADFIYMKVLEAGAKGVILPRIKTAEELFRAIRQVKFPPFGVHGVCPVARRWKYGVDSRQDPYGYIAKADSETFVAAIIELKEAIDNLDEILSVEGLDFIIWGPYDLALDMGFLGRGQEVYEEGAKKIDEIRQRVFEACAQKGVPFCQICGTPETARKFIAEGVYMLATWPDTRIIVDALSTIVRPLRGLSEVTPPSLLP